MFDEEGEKHGEWKAWHANGQLKEVTGYLHGQPDGLEAGWFKDGCRRFKSKRVNCVLHGSLKVWDRSGQLLQHWRYKEGISPMSNTKNIICRPLDLICCLN